MPELPEVETIKNYLYPLVINHVIESVEFLWANTLLSPSITEFNKQINGHTIENIYRRGKYLVFRLSESYEMLVHFRMTGSFLVSSEVRHVNKHIRAVVHLDKSVKMFFIDPRKFGKFQLVYGESDSFLKLGTEPLSDDFTVAFLTRALTDRKIPIKAFLVDQSCIAGIGNMYADEALYAAHIKPMRLTDSLSAGDVDALYRSIRNVLRQAIAYGGASVSDYMHPDGSKGRAQEYFKVAHRKGQNCYICGRAIERAVVRQRGTYFCPFCQK
jgi:formamidopyrimidine-DNA glycosylase